MSFQPSKLKTILVPFFMELSSLIAKPIQIVWWFFLITKGGKGSLFSNFKVKRDIFLWNCARIHLFFSSEGNFCKILTLSSILKWALFRRRVRDWPIWFLLHQWALALNVKLTIKRTKWLFQTGGHECGLWPPICFSNKSRVVKAWFRHPPVGQVFVFFVSVFDFKIGQFSIAPIFTCPF